MVFEQFDNPNTFSLLHHSLLLTSAFLKGGINPEKFILAVNPPGA
jgi:hypothetical protein